jgi:hypothetical protein
MSPSPFDTLDIYQNLAMRAMTCKKWRVRDGVLDLRGTRLANLPALVGFSVVFCLPDFRDAETLNCLLERVREAWGDPTIEVEAVAGATYPSRVVTAGGVFTGEVDAEALMLALEKSP